MNKESLSVMKEKYPLGTKIKWSGKFGEARVFEKGINKVVDYNLNPFGSGFCYIVLDDERMFMVLNWEDPSVDISNFTVIP